MNKDLSLIFRIEEEINKQMLIISYKNSFVTNLRKGNLLFRK